MNKTFTHIIVSLIVMLAINNLQAQSIYTYTDDFYGFPASTNVNINADKLLREFGATGAGTSCMEGFNTKNFSTSLTWDVSMPSVILRLTPQPAVTMNISSLSVDLRITGTGPVYVRLAYSVDAGATWIPSPGAYNPNIDYCGGSSVNATWDFTDFSTSSEVLVRIYGFGALDMAGRLQVKNLTVGGTVTIIDNDGDGYGIYIDCDDTDPSVNPGALDICNGIDDNCDGITDNLSVDILPNGDIFLCKHEFVTLMSPPGFDTYQWYKNGNPIVTGTSSTFTTDKPGYYQVAVTSATCYGISEVQAVAVVENPSANIHWPDGLDLCFNDTLKLKASYNDDYSWQWYKDGVLIPTETNYKMPATETGEYYCVVTNSNGCYRTTDTVIVINSCKTGSAVTDEMNTLQVYPNPSSDNFYVRMTINDSANEKAYLRITNIMGEVVYEKSITVANGLIYENVNAGQSFPSGIYNVTINTGLNKVSQQLVINK